MTIDRGSALSALAELLRRRTAKDPDLLELHGQKTTGPGGMPSPGYELLHHPDPKIAEAANKIYALYGQSPVTRDAVNKVLRGVSPAAAVRPGTPLSPHKVVARHIDTDHPFGQALYGDNTTPDPVVSVNDLRESARDTFWSATNDASQPAHVKLEVRNGGVEAKLAHIEDQLRELSTHPQSTGTEQMFADVYASEVAFARAFLSKARDWYTSGLYQTSDQELLDAIKQADDWEAANTSGHFLGTLLAGKPRPAGLAPTFQMIRRVSTSKLSNRRVSALPFNLQSASRSVRTNYVRQMGVGYTQSMPKDDQIGLIRAYVVRDVSPAAATNYQDVKDRLEAKAKAAYDATQAKLAAARAAKIAAQQAINNAPAAAVQPASTPSTPGLTPPDPVIHAASVPLTFTKTANQPNLGGWAEKFLVEDQFGNSWLAKPETGIRGGVSGAYRTDMEHAAHLIGNHLGYDTAESRITTINGRRVQVQRMFPGVQGDFVGGSPTSSIDVTALDARQLQDVADEHLLDWILANHDSHIENLLRLNNGTVVGIDKGQAFKYYGKDKLEVGYRPGPMQTKPNPIDEVYKAIIKGDIGKATADNMVRQSLQRAARIELASDQPIIDALLEAQKKRPKETYRDSSATNPQELADLVVARKRRLSQDFEKFYRDLYKQAGLTFDDSLVPDRKGAAEGKVEGVYSGLSEALFKDVARAKVHGVSTMFAGTDIEDGHILFWEEEWGGGKGNKSGTTTSSESVLDKLPVGSVVTSYYTDYEKKNSTTWEIAGSTGNFATPYTAAQLISASRSGRVEIKKDTSPMTSGKPVLRGQLTTRQDADTRITRWLTQHLGQSVSQSVPVGPPKTASDLYREDMWWTSLVEIAKNYAHHMPANPPNDRRVQQLAELRATMVDTLAAFKRGSSSALPTTARFDIARDPKGWQDMVEAYIAYADMLEQHRSAQTKPPRITRFDYKPSTPTAPAAVAAPTLNIKVTKVPNGRQHGEWDEATATLKVPNPDRKYTTSGEMFHVQVDDDTEIEYRPWGSSSFGVPVGQQGILRLTAKEFTGKPADLEKAFKVLREMGIDLKPAEREDLELLYWRQITGIATERADSTTTYRSALDYVRRNVRAGMSADQEIQAYKDAFAQVMPAGSTSSADYRPQFGRARIMAPDVPTGHPYWFRPDYSPPDMKRASKGHFATHALATLSVSIAKQGQLLSMEERIRTVGQGIGGNSGVGNQGSGGSNFVFAQFAMPPGRITFGRGSRGALLLLSPDVYRRTSTWNLNMMQGGQINLRRSSSSFDIKQWQGGSHNAVHIKHGISYLDDVEVAQFESERERKEAIKWYADHGITQIRGIPVEERFVLASGRDAAIAKAWAAYEHRAGNQVRAPRSTSSASALAIQTPDEAKTHLASLLASSNIKSKGFLNAIKRGAKMNAPVTGSRYQKYANAIKAHEARMASTSTPLPSRLSSIYYDQRMQVLIPEDRIDLFKLDRLIKDPAALAAEPPATVIWIDGKNMLYGGIEAFFARRLTGGRYSSQQVNRVTYYLSPSERAML